MSNAHSAEKPASAFVPGARLQRSFLIKRETIDAAARTVELAFASETPVDRGYEVEILSCKPGAVRLDRIRSGGALLCDHDPRDHIGTVESVQIGEDRVVRAVVRFGKSARAEEVFQDVVDGIRVNVSVGYMVHAATVVEKEDVMETYNVTDWEPYEISFVSIPADTAVGVGRAALAAPEKTELPLESRTMQQANEPVAAPAAPAAPSITSADVRNQVAAERRLIAEMVALGDTHERFGGRDLAKQAIEKGESLDALRSNIMNAMTAAQKGTTPPASLDMSTKEKQRYSLFKAIRALGDPSQRQAAGFELECHNEILKRTGLAEAPFGGFYLPVDIQQRDLTVGTASAGGNLVATNLAASSFIDILRARSVCAELGMTFLTGLVGNVAVPKLTGSGTAYWLTNEGTAITEGNHTFGQLALAPKTVGAYTELSRLLMLQSTPSAEALVMNDLAKVLALAIDLAVLEGSGSSGQPTGIANTASIGSVSGTSLALAGIIEFQTDVAAGNALSVNSAYVTTPTIAGLLHGRARIASTDSKTLWEGNILEGSVDGYRARTTTQLTASSMIFGDFAQVVLAEWGMLEIALNPYAAFSTAITGIRAIQTVDVGVRQAAAFSRATSIT